MFEEKKKPDIQIVYNYSLISWKTLMQTFTPEESYWQSFWEEEAKPQVHSFALLQTSLFP
jgi:hypothetical protein